MKKNSDEEHTSEKLHTNEKVQKKKSSNKSSTKNITKVSKKPVSEDHISDLDDHFFVPNRFLNSNKIKSLRSKKNSIIMIIGIFAGILLIIFGLILISVPLIKVSDNVIFGEKATFSAFLILMGILAISAILAHKLLSKTYLKKLNKKLQASEVNSTNSKNTDVNKKKNKGG